MKITLCIVSLAAGLSLGHGHAADSSLNITGNVVDNTCEIATESQNFTVDLQTHASTQFSHQGSTSEMVPFRVVFSHCGSAATGVKIGFNGVTVTPDSPLLKNEATADPASGIAIQLLDAGKEGVTVNPDPDTLNWNRIEAGAGNAVPFYARMIAHSYPVTAGRVRASATMTVEFQ